MKYPKLQGKSNLSRKLTEKDVADIKNKNIIFFKYF